MRRLYHHLSPHGLVTKRTGRLAPQLRRQRGLAQESFHALYGAILEEGFPLDLRARVNAIVKGKLLN